MTKINSAARIGGPIKKDKIFFFGDYQGTRTTEGLDTGLINCALARRGAAGQFLRHGHPSGIVQGAGLAAQLQNSLGYYGFFGRAVFHAGMHECHVRVSERHHPAERLDRSVPESSCNTFRCPMTAQTRFPATGDERLRDDKCSFRVDANSMRLGNLSAYYFFDDYFLNNPFPSGQGGATIPGFNGINHGRSQLISLGDTKTFGTATVNEAHFSYMRSANVVGQPSGGLGVSLASQGFNINPATGGIFPLAPQFEGVENTVFQGDFVMGVPITNVNQANNTFSAEREPFQKSWAVILIKAGIQVSFEQVNVNPNAIFDGTFIFDGYQTGNEFRGFSDRRAEPI